MSKSLIVRHIPPRSWWRKTCWALYRELDTGRGIVPADFVTDGASIPRFLWWLFNPMGLYAPAAVLHDYSLELLESIKGNKAYGAARKGIDKEFRDHMIELGVARWRAYPMYWAVRGFSLAVTAFHRLKSKLFRKGK